MVTLEHRKRCWLSSARRREGYTSDTRGAQTDRAANSHSTGKKGWTPHTWMTRELPQGMTPTHCHTGLLMALSGCGW